MEINSAFNAGVAGLNRSQQGLNRAAEEIAGQVTNSQDVPAPERANAQDPVEAPAETERPVSGENDLAESLVDLRAKQQVFDASAQVVRSADELVGTLIRTEA